MTMFHVTASVGERADDLLSLGLYEAPSARQALERCLGALDHDPIPQFKALLGNLEDLSEALGREQQQLRDHVGQPDAYLIVTPVDAEAHFVRDHDGEIKDAREVELKRARMRRDFGLDVV